MRKFANETFSGYMNFQIEMEIYFSSTKLEEPKQCFLRNDGTIRK